jgi:hypothetical protein
MTVDKRQVPESSSEDLSDLLSEVRRADVLANDPCTREFLQAGERLLHDILARDTGEVPARARSLLRAAGVRIAASGGRRGRGFVDRAGRDGR